MEIEQSGPVGGNKKAVNAVAKKRRKASGVTVKKVASGGKKPIQPTTKESNLGKTSSGDQRNTSVDKLDESVDNASNTDEDYSDDGDEGTDGYKLGGYHPVNIGDKFNARYNVVEKLGWGHFSTVWMCWDKKATEKGTSKFIALKIQKSAAHYREAALDEIELLACASKASVSDRVVQEFGPLYDPCVVLLLNHFDHNGPNGRHVCMSFEMLGDNLLKVIKKYDYRGIPIPIVKNFVRQILVGLDFLHRHCSIIHTDLKPENILIGTPPPTPSIEKVKKIIVDSNGGANLAAKTAKATAGGKKKKKKNVTAGGDVNSAIESMQKELDLGKALTAEERKKLKKKIKKKKQQVRKNETKKHDSPRVVKRRRSNELVAATEMMLMERESIPIAMKDEMNASCASLTSLTSLIKDDRVPKPPPIDDDDDSQDDKPDNLYGMDNMDNMDNLGHPGIADSIDDDDDEDNEMDERFRDFSLEREIRATTEYVREPPSMPSWLRPTLFGYLNFTDDGPKTEIPEVEAMKSPRVRTGTMLKNEYVKPASDDYARISVIAPYSRMVSVFGSSIDFDLTTNADSDTDYRYAQWFLSLPTSSSSAGGSGSGGGGSGGGGGGSVCGVGGMGGGGGGGGEYKSHFSVKGCGEDTAGISALMCSCLLDVLTQQPNVYSLQQPVVPAERPVLWQIEFSASRTIEVTRHIEAKMPGVYFLTHYDVPNVITEEDDSDLLYISRKLCLHSTTGENEEGVRSPRALIPDIADSFSNMKIHNDTQNTLKKIEERGGERGERGAGGGGSYQEEKNEDHSSSSSRRNSYTALRSGGALIGIDLDALSQRVFIASLEMEDEDVPGRPFFTESSDLRRFVKPLERRLEAFYMIDPLEVELVAEGYMFAVSDANNDGDSVTKFTSKEERDDDEKQRKSNAKILELEYIHAKVKIVDLGNACWTYKHFTDDIQTRQYRAPEVLLGANYETSVDIWSLACIIFELVTGDLLFDPQEGKCWDREEDHLAMMIELLGNFPKSVTTVGKFCGDYFNRKGELKHIHSLKFWGLREVLRDKYKLVEDDANSLADFLNSLLAIDPAKRVTAQEAQSHPWLTEITPTPFRAQNTNSTHSTHTHYDEKADEKPSSHTSHTSHTQHDVNFKSDKITDDRRPKTLILDDIDSSEGKNGRERLPDSARSMGSKSCKGEY